MTLKKTSLSLLTFALIASFSGCSDSNNNDTTTPAAVVTPTTQTVKVIDGYIMNATVCDANNVCAQTDATGSATAAFDISTQLTSTGGTIDANNNQLDDDAISALTLKSVAGHTNITPLTDLIANGADADKLAALLGLTSTDLLYADPIATNNLNLAKAIQLVYVSKVVGTADTLITSVNDYVVETPAVVTPATETNSSLPAIGSTTTPTVETTPTETPAVDTNSSLPAIGSTTAPTAETTPTETPAVDTNSSLPAFAPAAVTTTATAAQTINIDALATMILAATSDADKATVTALVDAIKTATGTAADLETTIATQKNSLVQTFTPSDFTATDVPADTTAPVADVTTDVNTTTDVATDITTDVNTTTTVTDANNTATATTTVDTTASALPSFGSDETATATTTEVATTDTTTTQTPVEDNTTTETNYTGSALPAF